MDKILGKFSKSEAVSLIVDGYKGVSSVEKYTAEERLEGSRELLKELVKDKGYRHNKAQIFTLVEEAIDQILPRRIEDTLGQFADVREYNHGEKALFRVPSGKLIAYFAAEGGVVNRHRLSDNTITVPTQAIQIEVYEERARILTGDVDFNDLIDAGIEAFEDKYYELVNNAFTQAYNVLPDTNKVATDEIEEDKLNNLIQIVGSYGKPVILGTGLGLAKLPKQLADQANADIYNNGYVGKYNGVDVIKLDNVVTDISNEEFRMKDNLLYIIPEGKDKIVKVATEGTTIMMDGQGEDWTENFMLHRRAGAAVGLVHHFGIYDIQSLAKK